MNFVREHMPPAPDGIFNLISQESLTPLPLQHLDVLREICGRYRNFPEGFFFPYTETTNPECIQFASGENEGLERLVRYAVRKHLAAAINTAGYPRVFSDFERL